MKLTKKRIALISLIITITHSLILPTTYWDWQKINTQAIQFPASFEWGVTTLMHEVEGYAKTSTGFAWENNLRHDGKPFTTTRSGKGCTHLANYKADVQLIKEMGLTTYCFSIDWSRIEPEQGCFDPAAIQQIIDLCDELVKNNISISIVLKDYCDPLWWGYLGGFEHEKNLYLFERYCLTMYELLNSKVDRWITFWAPENYAMLGYLTGSIPPGVSNLHRAATVLKNQYEAHVRVYKAIKETTRGNTSRVGIVKHIHLLEPWHPWDRASCYIANILTNSSFYTFFTTGTFNITLPLPGKVGAWVKHTNPYAPKSLDFIGINYHSHGYMKNITKHVSNPSEIPTDVTGISVYPEGLYSAIKTASDNLAKKLNIPIIITQNGIATQDESIRDLFIKRHLYALHKAKIDGYNVQGYYYYSLLDGFSWGSYDAQFGLFSVDRTTMERKQKTGSTYYRDTINKH